MYVFQYAGGGGGGLIGGGGTFTYSPFLLVVVGEKTVEMGGCGLLKDENLSNESDRIQRKFRPPGYGGDASFVVCKRFGLLECFECRVFCKKLSIKVQGCSFVSCFLRFVSWFE